MRATKKQCSHLDYLAGCVNRIYERYPQLGENKCPQRDWTAEAGNGMTVADASEKIDAYKFLIGALMFEVSLLEAKSREL